jgi:hypothetical protein
MSWFYQSERFPKAELAQKIDAIAVPLQGGVTAVGADFATAKKALHALAEGVTLPFVSLTLNGHEVQAGENDGYISATIAQFQAAT